ncbi:MAG: enoyl-CoA hydratase-related protein [Pseudomonadota bacterium]
MNFTTIRFETPETGIGLIILNRPERLNAINLDMLDDLHAVFTELLEMQEIRVVIIMGEGRGFCAGADIKDARVRREASALFSDAATHLVAIQKKYSERILEMRRLPQPIIAAVKGPAAGGGMCIALASDVVLASPSAFFVPSFINIGLSGGELGTSYLLPRMVGRARAAEILLTGRRVDAEEAARIGLVSRLVGEEDLLDTAMDIARTMLQKSPMGLRFTKEALNQNMNAPSLEAAIEFENRNQSICCCTPEFLEAVKAFSDQKEG